jgi:hypothetical protein
MHVCRFTQVNVSILDANNHNPVFVTSSAFVFVREDADVGSLVYVARATDGDTGRNGRLRYSIDGSRSSFAVDNRTGSVTIARQLDYESSPLYTVMVTANDAGDPSLSAVMTLTVSLLDVNDMTPTFGSSAYSFSAALPMPFGALIGSVQATDGDTGANAQLRYYLRNGRYGDLFDVRSGTGEIYSRTVFAAGSQSRYSLQVVAADGGMPALSSTVTVLVSLYDTSSPNVTLQFTSSQYTFNVTEGQPTETSVGFVGVVGVDRPTFALLSPNPYFFVVNASGEILTTAILDRESGDVYRLLVGVVGLSQQLIAHVTVNVLDVNEHVPEFIGGLPTFASVAENQPAGTSVAQVTALDPDFGDNGTVSYYFAPGKVYFRAGAD